MKCIALEQTRSGLALAEAAAIVRDTYAAMDTEAIEVSTPSSMPLGRGPERFRAKGAVLRRAGIVGARLNAPGHSMLMLWRLATGEPLALVEEEWLFKRRTGVSAAVVAQMLLPAGSRPRIALIGAGGIGRECAIALCGLVPFARLGIAARTAASARRLCAELAATGQPCVPCESVEEAVRDADLVIAITTAKGPIVDAAWVRPGATVLSMGGGCEFPHACWQGAAHRLVDDLDYALLQGDIAGWIARGETTAETVTAQITQRISDVARDGLRNRRDGEGVFAVVQGATPLDLALAHALLRTDPAGVEVFGSAARG